MSLLNHLNLSSLKDSVTDEDSELEDHIIIKTKCIKCDGRGVNTDYWSINMSTKLSEIICSECKGLKYTVSAIEFFKLETAIKKWVMDEITNNKSEFGEFIKKLLIDSAINS